MKGTAFVFILLFAGVLFSAPALRADDMTFEPYEPVSLKDWAVDERKRCPASAGAEYLHETYVQMDLGAGSAAIFRRLTLTINDAEEYVLRTIYSDPNEIIISVYKPKEGEWRFFAMPPRWQDMQAPIREAEMLLEEAAKHFGTSAIKALRGC